MNRYQRVEWHHDFDDDPIVIYSEIDDKGFEARKVEQFRDGSSSFADGSTATGSTWLTEVALPSLDDLAKQPAFKAEPIEADTFEVDWISAQERRA